MANPYLDDTVNNVLGDITRNYNLAVKPAFDSAMVRSGSFGNSGVQQMQSESQRQLQESLGRAASDLRYGDYQFDQQFGRQLFNDAFGQSMQGLQTGIGLLGSLNDYSQQDLSNATTVQNTPLNYWSQFLNGANGVGQGFGTTTGTQQMPGSPVLGALGGYQLGGAISKSLGGFGGSAGGNTQFPEWGMASGGTGGWV